MSIALSTMAWVDLYKSNDDFRLFVAWLTPWFFLPLHDVSRGMHYLKSIATSEALGVLNYFDTTYVNGGLRPARRQPRLRRLAPTFPPVSWNVHETFQDLYATHKQCLWILEQHVPQPRRACSPMCMDVNRRHTQRPGCGLHDFISAAQWSATAETRALRAISSAAATATAMQGICRWGARHGDYIYWICDAWQICELLVTPSDSTSNNGNNVFFW